MARKKKGPPFVMIYLDLLKDPEWRKLSSSAKIIYIYMRSKFNHKTLNEISLTYAEMTDMMSKTTMSKAFKDLIGAKLIEKVDRGGLFRGKTTYKFIGKHKDFYYNGNAIH